MTDLQKMIERERMKPMSDKTAEYECIRAFCKKNKEKRFLIEVTDLNIFMKKQAELQKYIDDNYCNFKLQKFDFTNSAWGHKVISKKTDYNKEEVINLVNSESKEANNFIVGQIGFNIVSFDGMLDERFESSLQSYAELEMIKNGKFTVKELPALFQLFQNRYDPTYIKNNKIDSEVVERDLRNDLHYFLEGKFQDGIVDFESATNTRSDLEAVDIRVYDKDNKIVIIEVKFIFQSKYYSSPKSAYTESRFYDGYEQLEKYFKHIVEQEHKSIDCGYLYMFVAHDDMEKLEKVQIQYVKDCKNNTVNFKYFKQYYNDTILHNVIAS